MLSALLNIREGLDGAGGPHVELKSKSQSKSLGCPHLAIFEKWGPTISTTHDATEYFRERFYTLSGVPRLPTPGKRGPPPGLKRVILSRAILPRDVSHPPSATPWRP